MGQVIYITSEEPYLLREKVKEVYSEYESTFNIKRIDKKATPEMVFDECNYYPVMANKRLLVLSEPEDSEDMALVLKDIPDYLDILLLGTLDKRKKLFKAIKKMNGVIDIPVLKEYEIKKWIKKSISSDQVVSLLIERVGITSMDLLEKEIRKLNLSENPNSLEVAEKTITRNLEADAFKLVSLISERKKKEAFVMAAEMYGRGEYLPVIVNLLNRNFAIMKLLKNKSETQVKEETGLHPYALKLLSGPAKIIDEKHIDFLLKATATTDFEMKNGEDHRLVLEKLIGVI